MQAAAQIADGVLDDGQAQTCAAALAGMVCDLRLCKLIDDIGSAFGMMLGITGACALVLLVSLISAISAAVP